MTNTFGVPEPDQIEIGLARLAEKIEHLEMKLLILAQKAGIEPDDETDPCRKQEEIIRPAP